jgi:hypothetical protein
VSVYQDQDEHGRGSCGHTQVPGKMSEVEQTWSCLTPSPFPVPGNDGGMAVMVTMTRKKERELSNAY